MAYFKLVENGYIPQIGTDCGGIEITETEYNSIKKVIDNRPNGNYKLKDDLTWELETVEVD